MREPMEYRKEYDVRHHFAAMTARGFVRFVNLRADRDNPQMWFCDECGERVTLAKQAKHAEDHQ